MSAAQHRGYRFQWLGLAWSSSLDGSLRPLSVPPEARFMTENSDNTSPLVIDTKRRNRNRVFPVALVILGMMPSRGHRDVLRCRGSHLGRTDQFRGVAVAAWNFWTSP